MMRKILLTMTLAVIAMFAAAPTQARADVCTGSVLAGHAWQWPSYDPGEAIDLYTLGYTLVRIKITVAGPSSTTVAYTSYNSSVHNGYWNYTLPHCGDVTVRVILDPVSDGNGGYTEGVKLGGLPTRFPNPYADPSVTSWIWVDNGGTYSGETQTFTVSSAGNIGNIGFYLLGT